MKKLSHFDVIALNIEKLITGTRKLILMNRQLSTNQYLDRIKYGFHERIKYLHKISFYDLECHT